MWHKLNKQFGKAFGKATVEAMRAVLAEGTLEHMDEHWNLTPPVHHLILGLSTATVSES